jgi:hypothetical protein
LYDPGVSLRGHPVEERATLPDGREVVVRVGVAVDPYIKRKELDTVSLELFEGEVALAAVNTLLEPHHTGEARTLAREVVEGLESGDLEPTAGAIEPLADTIPPVGETR